MRLAAAPGPGLHDLADSRGLLPGLAEGRQVIEAWEPASRNSTTQVRPEGGPEILSAMDCRSLESFNLLSGSALRVEAETPSEARYPIADLGCARIEPKISSA